MKLLTLVFCLGLAGCAASNPAAPSTPANPQSIDLTMAKGLLSAQTAIQALSPLVPVYPALKTPLDDAAATYNAAESAYLIWHNALASGGTPDATLLAAQIAQLASATQTLTTQFGGK